MGEVAKRLRITGHVQGVWYRAWLAEQAKALGVRGWVRNRSDGSVETLVVGPDAVLDTLIERCRVGPDVARVDDIVIESADAKDAVPSFEKRPTL